MTIEPNPKIPKKRCIVSVEFSPEEKAVIMRMAAEEDRSVSRFIKRKILVALGLKKK